MSPIISGKVLRVTLTFEIPPNMQPEQFTAIVAHDLSFSAAIAGQSRTMEMQVQDVGLKLTT